MIQDITSQIKLLLIFVTSLYFRIVKFIKYVWFNKHEVERIIDSDYDFFTKTVLVENWLNATKSTAIRRFHDKNFIHLKPASLVATTISYITQHDVSDKSSKSSMLNFSDNINHIEDADYRLASVSNKLAGSLTRIIIEEKDLISLSSVKRDLLTTILNRILAYRLTLLLAQHLASIKYDATLDEHTSKLIAFWNNLVRSAKQDNKNASDPRQAFPDELLYEIDNREDIVSSRWSHIGFQGEDPGTDFRGMGLLGLIQLEYLSRKPKKLACDLLRSSLDERYNYPLAILGINISYHLLSLYRDGSLKHLYYDTNDPLFRKNQRSLKIISTLNDLYVELFLRFDCFWRESKPKNIFEFKSLIEQFVDIVKLDLRNRNFSLRFIY